METMTRYEEMERCKNHKSFVLQTLLFILAFPMLHTSQDAFLGGVLVHVMSQSGVRKDKAPFVLLGMKPRKNSGRNHYFNLYKLHWPD